MPHSLIVGMTETGKSMLAKEYAQAMRAQRRIVAVLDPMRATWDADYQTLDPEQFKFFLTTRCNVSFFADECGTSISRYDTRWDWLLTSSRHMGHNGYLIGNKLTQFNTVMRCNARTLLLFAGTTREEMKLAGSEFNHRELTDLAPLECRERQFGQFYRVHKFRPVEKYRLDFRTRRVTLIVPPSTKAASK